MILTASMGSDGKPVNGNGEVLRIKFSCVKCCPCLSELIPADFEGGLAGAKPIKGQARCRKSTQDMKVTPIPPPTELSVAVGHDETICGTDIKTTVTVYGAVNITEFGLSVLYNDRCLGYVSVSDADATKKWDIKGKAEKTGTMVITGKKGEQGKPINGMGEIATIRFHCCAAAIIWWPWATLGAAGLIAGAGAGTAIVIENKSNPHGHKEKRHPSSPIIPPE